MIKKTPPAGAEDNNSVREERRRKTCLGDRSDSRSAREGTNTHSTAAVVHVYG
jgi:hypothetical protein